jgi:hypothetical protein
MPERTLPPRNIRGRRSGRRAEYEERRTELNLEHLANHNKSRYEAAIAKVQQEHPEIDPKLLEDIRQEYMTGTDSIKDDIRDISRFSPDGVPPDRRWISQQVDMIQGEQSLTMRANIERKYGQKGIAALELVSEEARPKGMVGGLLSKLGTTGGMIGAAAGGLLAFMGMGGMGGGVLSIIGAIVGVVGGGLLGNSVGGMVTGNNNPPSNALAAQAAGQSRGVSRGNGPSNEREQDLSAADTGTMASPASPRVNTPSQAAGVTFG